MLCLDSQGYRCFGFPVASPLCFRDDYPTDEIVGRRLWAEIAGHHVGVTYQSWTGVSTVLDCRYGVPHDHGAHAVAQDDWTAAAGSPENPGFVIFDP